MRLTLTSCLQATQPTNKMAATANNWLKSAAFKVPNNTKHFPINQNNSSIHDDTASSCYRSIYHAIATSINLVVNVGPPIPKELY